MVDRSAGTIRVDGARELRASLKRAGEDVTDLKDAHRGAADVVTPVARSRSPHLSGTLAGTVRGSGTAAGAVIRAGGAKAPYAGPIHWGWPARGIEPRPFITEAAQQTQPEWVEKYEAAVERILDRVKGT